MEPFRRAGEGSRCRRTWVGSERLATGPVLGHSDNPMSPLRIVDDPSASRELRALDGGPDVREVPAVAVCAVCGDPSCPGHDFEQSGERPIHRTMPWEDGETPPLRALFQTAMMSASDLGLWARASRGPAPTGGGVAPAFTFALACELIAVAATTAPLTALGAGLCYWITKDAGLTAMVAAACVRAGVVFVPVMLAIHVVHQLVVAKVGGRHATEGGYPYDRTTALRAGLFACGWDLATGPLGVLGPLLRGRFAEAAARLRGNSELYRTSTRVWLTEVHGVESEAVERAARRAAAPFMVALVLVACAAVGLVMLRSF